LTGKPGPGDTGAFNDKTVPLQICATDSDQEACSVFDLSVQGKSNAEIALAIFGPLAAIAGLALGWYSKRGVILNPWNRKNYDKGTKTVSIGMPFSHQFKIPKSKIKLVKAFKGRRMLGGLPAPKKLDEKGCLEWLKHDRSISGGSLLPDWIRYDAANTQLISNYVPRTEDFGLYTVRAYGHGEVILEEVRLDVGGQGSKNIEMFEM
jgi:hypothetical protein